MNYTPPARQEPRVIDLSAEVKRMLGKELDAPSVEYEFSNGKVFKRRTEEAEIYSDS